MFYLLLVIHIAYSTVFPIFQFLFPLLIYVYALPHSKKQKYILIIFILLEPKDDESTEMKYRRWLFERVEDALKKIAELMFHR